MTLGEWTVGLKLNIQKTKVMASGPIASWQTDGETVETVIDFIFWGSKITADGDCSHEIISRISTENTSCQGRQWYQSICIHEEL